MVLSSSSVRPSFVKRSMIRVMVLLPIPYRFFGGAVSDATLAQFDYADDR